jgi:hypothetical protein
MNASPDGEPKPAKSIIRADDDVRPDRPIDKKDIDEVLRLNDHCYKTWPTERELNRERLFNS